MFPLYDPLGTELTHNELPNIKKVAGQAQAVWVNLAAIPILILILSFGNYAGELGVGDQRYRRSVHIFQ